MNEPLNAAHERHDDDDQRAEMAYEQCRAEVEAAFPALTAAEVETMVLLLYEARARNAHEQS